MSEIGWGNCLFHGLRRWKQRRFRGALVITKSPNCGFRVHTSDKIPADLESFVPLHPREGWKAWLHKIWFKGRIERRTGEQ